MLAIMWRAAGVCLLLAVSACENERRSSPTAPMVPTVPDVASAPVPPTFTLSGAVTERFSGRPVQGAKVWIEPLSLEHAPGRRWPVAGMRFTPSDETGRYIISGLPPLGLVWVSTAQTWGDPFSAPYVHQCVTTVTVDGDTTFDVTISSTGDLVAVNASTGPTPPNSRIVSGTVFEATAHGREPLRNVWVGWEGSGSGDAFAETRTDAAGRYRLCGLPKERVSIAASPAWAEVFYAPVAAGSDATLDIEVKR